MFRVIHFEIAANNPQKAVNFYAGVFGWKIEKWAGGPDYWLVTTGPDNEPGINGGIMKRTDPAMSTVNSIGVPSVDDYVKKIEQNGGKVIIPKTPIPGIGYFAYCLDTENNMFGIIQDDKSVT